MLLFCNTTEKSLMNMFFSILWSLLISFESQPFLIFSANSCMDFKEARSSWQAKTCRFSVVPRISLAAASHFSMSRQPIMIRPPIDAGKKSQCGTGFEIMHLFWCDNFRRHHSLRTSLCQFQSRLFPDARVGSCYDNSLPINGGLTGTPTSSQMVPVKNSGCFVFLIRTRSCVFLWL